MMKHEKVCAAILALALLLGILSGCAAAPAASESTPLPTATPIPTPMPPPPEGMEKVFGKDIAVALYAKNGEDFAAGVLHEANRLGIPVTEVTDAAAANEADLCIGYGLSFEEASEITVPLSLYTTDDRVTADALLYYDGSAADLSAMAWEALFHYPAHESPIRLFTLLDVESIPEAIEPPPEEGEEAEAPEEAEEPEEAEAPEEAAPETVSPADPYEGWSSGARTFGEWQDQGKLQSRGMYHGRIEGATQWLTDALGEYIPGTVDTIFAETPELALTAYEVLYAANRSDAVEVIAAGLDWDILSAMMENHFLFGAAAGPDRFSAGALALRRGLEVLIGESPAAMILTPVTIYSDDVYALVQEGLVNPAAIAIALNEELNAQSQREEWTYLAEYYAE